MIRLRSRVNKSARGLPYESHYITIPSEIVRALGWKANDLLELNIIPLKSSDKPIIALLIYKIGE
ncbi:MAG: hypothetical protein ACPL07_00485 [Candidatus Bathyarchaeia archaeon]|jgi:hypothetical protein